MAEDLFRAFSEACEQIRATSSKLKKVKTLSQYLSSLDAESLPIVCRLLSGYIFPRGSAKEANIGYSALVDVVLDLTSSTWQRFNEVYLKHGDLGMTAEEMLAERRVSPLFKEELRIPHLHSAFDRMACLKGPGSTGERKSILKGLLLSCSPLEAKYLTKILTGELRIGMVEGLVEEGISQAFKSHLEDVRKAHLVAGDIGAVAQRAREGRLGETEIELMHPTNFMLADALPTASDIAAYFKKDLYAEYKYDGVRAQAHKGGERIRIYSRRLEDVSKSFPDIVEGLSKVRDSFILDGEVLAYRDERPLPFHLLQHRLRRKAIHPRLIAEIPLIYFVFDLLYLNGRVMTGEPLEARRRALESLVFEKPVMLSHLARVETGEEIEAEFRRSRELGYEGLLLKDPNSLYRPGRRGRHWVKLKKELDTLDVVIVAAEYGHGKRAGVLSDYTFAVRDEGELKVVGKAYSGLTDEEIQMMTERLKEITVQDMGHRRLVKPRIVLEVAFDRVQKSLRHDSGYALRFPRIKRIREDKGPEDIDTLGGVEEVYMRQLGRS